MDQAALLQMLTDAMWVAAKVSMPILLTSIVVGVLVGLVQSITQIQEQTLTFVPKFLAVGVVLIVSGSWMMQMLVDFTRELIARIPSYL
ncbi:MAG: flagellar biosynthesis protein FliQ [Acidimicrobiales bacterium]